MSSCCHAKTTSPITTIYIYIFVPITTIYIIYNIFSGVQRHPAGSHSHPSIPSLAERLLGSTGSSSSVLPNCLLPLEARHRILLKCSCKFMIKVNICHHGVPFKNFTDSETACLSPGISILLREPPIFFSHRKNSSRCKKELCRL